MEPSREYNLTLNFTSFEALHAHLEIMDEFIAWRETRLQKKASDRRGKHIGAMHFAARTFKAEHPDLSYRECMRRVAAAAASAAPETKAD